MLLIRYLFGFRGSSLTQGAVDLDSLEMTAEELELLIEQNLSVLDRWRRSDKCSNGRVTRDSLSVWF